MGEYVAAVWGWDEEEQRDYHARAFDTDTDTDTDTWQIITAGTVDVGMLNVERHPTGIYLSRLEIAPDHQGRGIGTRIINELRAQAAEHGHPVTLDVLAVNTDAQRLYRRLGFTESHRHGTGDVKIRMVALPRPAANPGPRD